MGKKKRRNANNRFSPLAPTHTCQIPVTTLSRINLLEIENKAKDESIQRLQNEIREMERRCKDYEGKVNHLNDKLTFAAKTDPRMTAIQHPIPQTSSGIFDGEMNRDRHRSHSVALQYFSTLVKISLATI